MRWKTDKEMRKMPPPPKPPSPPAKEEPAEEKPKEEKPKAQKRPKTKKQKNKVKKPRIGEKSGSPHKSKQAQLLAELIDTKIDARVSPIEGTLAKMFKLLKSVKEVAAPTKITELENEVISIKETLEDLNVESLEEDVSSKFEKLSKKLLSSIKEHSSAIEGLEEAMKKQAPEEEPPGIQRDIESLKTKAHWLEMELEKVNLKPLIAKIGEIESRMNTIKLQQPMIIE